MSGGPAVDDESPERLARAALSHLVGYGNAGLTAAIRALGPAEAWEQARPRHPDIEPRRDLDRLREVGGWLLCPGDPGWPDGLAGLDRAADRAEPEYGTPLALWCRGAADLSPPGPTEPTGLTDCDRHGVAVVGSRAATGYGQHVAGELACSLAERGWTVVSGAAFGIDAAAHRGALAGDGVTVAVLACGVDIPYPAAHLRLLDEIRERGLLVSEVPPGSPPLRRRFLIRNRLIAGLARGTVLVEAGPRSGALSTARHARRLGRGLMVVPGPVTSAMSVGCHRLLREHREVCALVTDARDVEEEIGPIGLRTDDGPSAGDGGPSGSRDGLPAVVRALLEAMPARGCIGVAVLAARIGQRPRDVLAMLGPLAVEGLVEARPDGYRLTALGRGPIQARPGRDDGEDDGLFSIREVRP
ncbi:DNA-protecting protein DprA [Frankia sp. AgB1.9]|uniref:DNA-processing protein DprA n=1 Tax=unclassified Frankia TaxID=2632575 RepID=UPI001934113B|nr:MULTISPECIES: DNA-processing protein DprA [unclassified Frankia]MBL7491123.1 DNA-protecting protein DprA [Frankia sp. AgW1.1]MBL7546877.1 DNA-protecting protein DprA [Frankia sp. AgB1.9]MBL7617757.1 DNA-protecting protein DprA [Frankia sp. AgB1.8]